jgi:hypothetical protein
MPDGKYTLGVLTGIADVLIWKHFVGPSVADIRIADPFDGDLESAERTGLIAGTVFTLLVAGLSRSLEVFAIGGAVLVALDFATKHANAVNPSSGKMSLPTSTTYPLPDYGS